MKRWTQAMIVTIRLTYPSAEHWNPHHQVPVNLNLRSTVNPYLEQYLPNPARPDRNSINNKRTPGTYSCSRKHLHSSHNGYNGRPTETQITNAIYTLGAGIEF